MYRAILVSISIVSLIGCGGRTDGTGGGSGGNGGGSSSNGGGTASNGGGTASNGGGTASNGGGTTHTGGGTASNGGGTTAAGGGTSSTDCSTTITVNDATTNLLLYNHDCVTIVGAVVVGASLPFMSTSSTCTGDAMTETFYIQDPSGSEGVAVYRSCHDGATSALPNVGDIVTVVGYLAQFDYSLQIASSSTNMISESVTITAVDAGRTTSPALPPAGMPLEIAASDMSYAHDVPGLNPHPENLGQAIHFAGVTVTDEYPPLFRSTLKDGGSTPAGFQLSNGVWVDDTFVYYDCIRPNPADAGINLPNGIRGFWDRYQDYYGFNPDGGYSPAYPVLIPMTCADMQ